MISHDVTAAERHDSDLVSFSLTDHPLASENAPFFQVGIASPGGRFRQGESGSGRCVFFEAVMGFHHFHIKGRSQFARNHLHHLRQKGDANAHIGCLQEGYLFCDTIQFLLLFGIEPGRAQDYRAPGFRGNSQMFE
jgi:hypothetical protein